MQKLMFIIDEGIGGTELISLYKNDISKLKLALDNIYEGLKPLQSKYKVVLLIYPTHFYNELGGTAPHSRIANELKYVFEYFKDKDMNLYLEIHSSGIYTNQNGELADLPLAPLHYGEEQRYKSLPMDMECLAWLKQTYGDVFEGVRFHELVGSHEIGLHDRARGQEHNSHAFVVQDIVMRGIIDTVKACKLQLAWGDHSFNLVAEQPEIFGCFKQWLDYAVDLLGKEYLTLNWANNGWPMHKYIVGDFAFKGYRGVNTGMSVQSWFWQETDSSTMRVIDECGNKIIKWHAYAELECPVELMYAYTKKYLDMGCTLIQYEPSHYFFNFYRPGKTLIEFNGNVEKEADYSLRLVGKRFIEMMLNGTDVSSDPVSYFDKDEAKFKAYREGQNAMRYAQSSLLCLGVDDYQCFDVYNNNPNKILQDNKNRIIMENYKNLKCVSAIRNGYSGLDLQLVLDNNDCVKIYTSRHGVECSFKLKEKNIKKIVPMNLISEFCRATDGDNDELIVFYSDYEYNVYKSFALSNELERKYEYRKIKCSIDNILQLDKEKEIIDIIRIRTRNALLPSSTRPIENSIVAIYRTKRGVLVKGSINGNSYEKQFELKGEVIAISAFDYNIDFFDEIAVITKDGLFILDLKSGKIINTKMEIKENIDKMFSLRSCFNQKAFDMELDKENNALLL